MRKYLLILLSVTFFLLLFSNIAYAIPFNPQISIPNSDFQHSESENPGDWMSITPSTLGKYIKAIYTYAIGVVGILSTVVIIFGGFLWATAAGNNSRVDNAKTWITSALTGLVLALFSYTLLYMINPALVELKSISPRKAGAMVSCCDPDPQTGGHKIATAIENTNPIRYDCRKHPTGTQLCAKDQMCKKVEDGYTCINTKEALEACSNSYVGAPCRITNMDKGYCTADGCQPCKQTGASCSGVWAGNHECCNGDCVDNSGTGTGNSCN